MDFIAVDKDIAKWHNFWWAKILVGSDGKKILGSL